jgi:hypothetical protein
MSSKSLTMMDDARIDTLTIVSERRRAPLHFETEDATLDYVQYQVHGLYQVHSYVRLSV